MSQQELSRRTAVEVVFDGVDITENIRPYLLSVTYTDNEEGETDDLQLRVQDRDGPWLQGWLDEVIDAAASGGGAVGAAGGTAAEIQAGTAVQLTNVPFYYTSTAPDPSAFKSGTFYFYDGVQINGRCRMTNSAERCGKLPVGENVTGWVEAGDCTPEAADGQGGSPAAAGGGSLAFGGKLKFSAAITQVNWGADLTLPTGEFELDGVSYDGPPSTATIKGTSLPFSAPIRQTKKSKAWETYYLSGIAGEIAAANGLRCRFESDSDPFYERVEQRKTSDSAFLARLCKDAGISIKATDGEMVLFDQAKYEAQAPVLVIRKAGAGEKALYTKFSLSVGAADFQYGSCRVSYVDPGSGRCVEGSCSSGEEETGQCLEVTAKVSSGDEARALAEKRLRLHNKFTRFASFTMPGNPALVAGVTVQLEGWGGWDGKYIVRQAVHTAGSGGYSTQIKGRRCLRGY